MSSHHCLTYWFVWLRVSVWPRRTDGHGLPNRFPWLGIHHSIFFDHALDGLRFALLFSLSFFLLIPLWLLLVHPLSFFTQHFYHILFLSFLLSSAVVWVCFVLSEWINAEKLGECPEEYFAWWYLHQFVNTTKFTYITYNVYFRGILSASHWMGCNPSRISGPWKTNKKLNLRRTSPVGKECLGLRYGLTRFPGVRRSFKS